METLQVPYNLQENKVMLYLSSIYDTQAITTLLLAQTFTKLYDFIIDKLWIDFPQNWVAYNPIYTLGRQKT